MAPSLADELREQKPGARVVTMSMKARSAIGLAGRAVKALRIAPYESSEPWRVGEVLLHPEPARAAWDEWLPPSLDWEARRRALVDRPRTDREDWYSRVLLAARHRPLP